MCLIFVGQGYPRKLFNLEHFPIYGTIKCIKTNLKISDIHYHTQTLITNIITNVLSVIPDTITINTFAIVLSMCLCLWIKYFLLVSTGGFIKIPTQKIP